MFQHLDCVSHRSALDFGTADMFDQQYIKTHYPCAGFEFPGIFNLPGILRWQQISGAAAQFVPSLCVVAFQPAGELWSEKRNHAALPSWEIFNTVRLATIQQLPDISGEIVDLPGVHLARNDLLRIFKLRRKTKSLDPRRSIPASNRSGQ